MSSASRLLSLPNEIILFLISELPSADIPSFALCNKATHSLCENAIHQIFEERYAVIRLGGPVGASASTTSIDPCRGHHPLMFLDRILSKPHIAQYPTELQIEVYVHDEELGYMDYEDEENDLDRATLANAISTWSSELASQGADNPWLTDTAKREEWRYALLQPGNQFHFVGILLTMLLNVESITITNARSKARPLLDMVSAIAAANLDPSSPVRDTALAKLHEVALDDTFYREFGVNAKYYEPFAALPSMRSLHGRRVAGSPYNEPSDLLNGVKIEHSQVTMIRLVRSAISPRSLERMIGLMAALKTFTYHHACHSVAQDRFGAPEIVTALARHASHSLERLDLTADERWWKALDYNEMFRGQQRQRIPSLRGFTKLKTLRVDDKLLEDSAYHGGVVTKLVDVLPASIQVIKLIREMKADKWERLFSGLVEGKEESLPNMKKICIVGDQRLPESLVHDCKAVGVELKGGFMR